MLCLLICYTAKVLMLLKVLMTKFIDFNMLTRKENWLSVNLKQRKAVKTNLFDVGAKTKSLLLELDFRSHTLSCLISATTYLQEKLPLNNEVLKDALFLNPISRNIKSALNGISRLILTFSKLLKTSLPMVINLKGDSVDDYKLCDIMDNKFTLY